MRRGPTEQLCLKDGRACNDVVPTLCTGSTLQLCSAGFDSCHGSTDATSNRSAHRPPASPTETPTIYDPAVPTMKPTNPTEKPTIAPTTAAPTEQLSLSAQDRKGAMKDFLDPLVLRAMFLVGVALLEHTSQTRGRVRVYSAGRATTYAQRAQRREPKLQKRMI